MAKHFPKVNNKMSPVNTKVIDQMRMTSIDAVVYGKCTIDKDMHRLGDTSVGDITCEKRCHQHDVVITKVVALV